MLKNYLKIAFRNLLKFKTYSLINITGLAVGVAACILILLYVKDELSFDKYNLKADRIYRVYTAGKLTGRDLDMIVTPAPLGQTFVHDFPEVVQYTRLMPNSNMLIRYKDNVFNEKRFFWADSTIFDVFTIPFIEGNPKTALNQPHTVVLTESLAKKYFGSEDPMDKIMNFEDGTAYTVRGVVKDCPVNSHFHYDIFASMASIEAGKNTLWIANNFYTYIVLKKGASAKALEDKIPELVKKYAGPQLYQAMGIPYEEFQKKGDSYEFHLQRLTDIHLKSNLDYEIEPNGDISYVYIFSIIALFILLIACINFMNLTTARSTTRSKEVGIRKVLGSNKTQLIKQFLAESILLSFIAVLVAIALVETFLPSFNDLAAKQLETNFTSFSVIAALVVGVLIIGLIAGSYPAFFLSHYKPVKVLKGALDNNKRSWLRSGLVVFQFAISIILFIGTLVIYSQLQYIQDKKLGFDREHVLVINRAWALDKKTKTFKDELLKDSHVISATNCNNIPGRIFGQTVFKAENAPASQQSLLAIMSADYNFAKTLKLKLEDGRYFSINNPSDSLAVVINESAVRILGLKNPVGKRIILVGPTAQQSVAYNIIGVLKDFNFESLHQKIRPLAVFLRTGLMAYLPIRISPKDVKETVALIQNKWKRFVPDKPLEYFFLDDDFNTLYSSEQKTGQIFTVFSVLAIFIACLGLLGLAAFTAERRTKEIGIRKVLGASVPGIVFALSKEFIKWVLIANVIAWPIAYYFMNKWLEDFAYRINMPYWVFFISAVAAMIIAVITVSSQTIKAANSNPVKSLRYE
jgi:putative ABC transport system permease protein